MPLICVCSICKYFTFKWLRKFHRSPPIAAVGAAEQQLLVVQLPGLDGSLFHFRALDEWLALEQTRTHAVTVDSFDDDIEAWLSGEAARAAAAARAGERLVLLGYSAGGTLAQAFHRLVQASGCPVAALILMDPALAPADYRGTRPEASHASVASSFMANSVMEQARMLKKDPDPNPSPNPSPKPNPDPDLNTLTLTLTP